MNAAAWAAIGLSWGAVALIVLAVNRLRQRVASLERDVTDLLRGGDE